MVISDNFQMISFIIDNHKPFCLISFIKASNMWTRAFLVIILLVSLSQSKVYVLDDTNYHEFLTSNPYILIQLNSRNSERIKEMQIEFQGLEQYNDDRFALARANLQANPKLKLHFKIEKSYSIFLIANGTKMEYSGAITAQLLQAWFEKYLISKIITISQQQLNEKIEKGNILAIKGASLQQMKVLKIAHFLDTSTEYYYLGEGDFSIKLYRNTKNQPILDYQGQIIVQDLNQWTYLNTLPSLIYINSDKSLRAVFENPLNISVFLLYKTKDFSQQDFERLKKVCLQHSKEFACGYVDNQSKIYNKTAKYLKLTDYSASVLAYLRYGLKDGYIFSNLSDLSNYTLDKFFKEIAQGKIPSFIGLKQERSNLTQYSQGFQYKDVTKLTDQNYSSVIQGNRLVFVEYYSPSCDHCSQFVPQYEKMAKNANIRRLKCTIAALDYTNNQQIKKKVYVKQFPTFKLYINGAELPYEGQRDIEKMLDFIEKIANAKLKTATTQNNIPMPYIAIYGITENSPYHILPLYSSFPIYHIQGTKQFKIKIVKKNEHSSLSDQMGSLLDIIDWIEETAQPLVIGVAEQRNSKKLNEAITRKRPLLVIVQRDSSAKHVLKIMENYCIGRFQILCGKVSTSDYDYESFNKWLDDKKPDRSVLTIIDTAQWKSYIFPGNLQKLNESNLQNFVGNILGELKKKKAANESAENNKKSRFERGKQQHKDKRGKKGSNKQQEVVFSQDL